LLILALYNRVRTIFLTKKANRIGEMIPGGRLLLIASRHFYVRRRHHH